MKKRDQNTWYMPLLAQFQMIEDPMPLSRFAAIEAFLHLLSLTSTAGTSRSISALTP